MKKILLSLLFLAAAANCQVAPFNMVPSSGQATQQLFAVAFYDAAGISDLREMLWLMNDGLHADNGCTVYYYKPANMLLLLKDDGSDWLWDQQVQLGTNTVASNRQCSIIGKSSSLTTGYYTNTQLFNLYVVFKPGFAGYKYAYALVTGINGSSSNWQQMGTYTVPIQNIVQSLVPDTTPHTDDYTGGIGYMTAVKTVSTKNGDVKIKRADRINVGAVTYETPAPAAGGYSYVYHFDNRQVDHMRLGHSPMLRSIQTKEPAGWISTTTGGWVTKVSGEVFRGDGAEFSITSAWRPGLMPMYLASKELYEPVEFPAERLRSTDFYRAVNSAGIHANSVKRYVIGPAIAADATADDIRQMIRSWAEVDGFDFLASVGGDGDMRAAVLALKPNGKLESDIVECLLAVL